MTQDQLIELGQQCGLIGMRPHLDGIYLESLINFAQQAIAWEREECAKIVEPEEYQQISRRILERKAAEIRARGLK
jgi:hypothetical protein